MKMKRIVVLLVLAARPMSALADFSCNTTLNAVLLYQDGSVNILHPARNDYTYVCNLQVPRLGVDTVTCAMWASLLLAAHKDRSQVTFLYPGSGSCATLPIYSNSPAPTYIGKSGTP